MFNVRTCLEARFLQPGECDGRARERYLWLSRPVLERYLWQLHMQMGRRRDCFHHSPPTNPEAGRHIFKFHPSCPISAHFSGIWQRNVSQPQHRQTVSGPLLTVSVSGTYLRTYILCGLRCHCGSKPSPAIASVDPRDTRGQSKPLPHIASGVRLRIART